MIVSRVICAVFIPIVAGFCSGAGLSAKSSLLVCKKVWREMELMMKMKMEVEGLGLF